MIKKKDPYIALLDFYYERFPEPLTLKETYEFFDREGYISSDELEVIQAFGSERQPQYKKEPEIEKSAERKRVAFLTMFTRSGDNRSSSAGRNAPHIMNSEHYFYRLEYKKFLENRKASRLAFLISILAIIISMFSLYISWNASQKPPRIIDSQIDEIIDAIGQK